MKKFLIVIERAQGNYSAYSPDLLGCVATGRTRAEVRKNMAGAIQMHLAGMREDELAVPTPSASAEYVIVE